LVKTLPIGIEPSNFHERLNKVDVQEMIRTTRENFSGANILIGIDRLDYVKGIPQKLQALDEFFQKHPDQVGRIVLVQVVIPSRANLEVNQKLRREIQELVGKINGKYGTPKHLFRDIFLHSCRHGQDFRLEFQPNLEHSSISAHELC
jgi:trehalose-6-phosphate synthase